MPVRCGTGGKPAAVPSRISPFCEGAGLAAIAGCARVSPVSATAVAPAADRNARLSTVGRDAAQPQTRSSSGVILTCGSVRSVLRRADGDARRVLEAARDRVAELPGRIQEALCEIVQRRVAREQD